MLARVTVRCYHLMRVIAMLQMDKCKNSKKQGDVGMGVAIGWFAADGYTVCVPLTYAEHKI